MYISPTDDGVGYISISGFNAGAANDFKSAMLMLRQAAPNDLHGLVLDLRGKERHSTVIHLSLIKLSECGSHVVHQLP